MHTIGPPGFNRQTIRTCWKACGRLAGRSNDGSGAIVFDVGRDRVGPRSGVHAPTPQPDFVASLYPPKHASLLLMRKGPDNPRPTLEQLRQGAPWLRVWCRNCHCRHKAPMALAPLIIRWGGDASSDVFRRSARCTYCRRKGADLQHPSARSSDIALAYHTRTEDWAG